MIKSAEPYSLFLVRLCLFQWNLSCIFIWEEGCEFKGSRKVYLVKMNCHVCLTDTYNEISVGTYQRGNVGNKWIANPLTLLWLNSFFLETLLSCYLSELSYSSQRVILSSSIDTGTQFKKALWDWNNKQEILCWQYQICSHTLCAVLKPASFVQRSRLLPHINIISRENHTHILT